ncbi:MAG: molybdopterin-synthase adenylyltransferase MoeB [marine bacterium B5-7]|nr:MAG: molybdopterin-synthase adenylyltransferase MoeB [marine bacterium B5-7]
MNQTEELRYSRQIKLPQIGEAGQQAILDSRVLIIGMGGLGSPASMYLAAAGVGHLVISDFDRVDESNLQRQIVHGESSIGESKASSAKHRLRSINGHTRIDALDYELDSDDLDREISLADVVVDCTDNFTSRFALNRTCLAKRTPLVSAAAIRFEAQLSTFDPRRQDSPCYRCLYPDTSVEGATCAAEGVMAPLVGIVGSIQAMETLKLIADVGTTLCGRLLLIDAQSMEFQSLALNRNPQCVDCRDRHANDG